MDYILSFDLGTSAIKVALFDAEGTLLASSNHEYDLLTPTALAVEVAVETYWQAFKAGVAEVLECSGVERGAIKALGISAQGETLIFVDEQGKPLRNAIVWMDNRAQQEAEILSEAFADEDVYGITGQVSIVPTWPAAKVFWVKRNEPEVFENTAKVLLIEDYFIARLTGEFVAEGSLLCSTVYWDIKTKQWWRKMIDYLGLSEEMLPEIRESGEPIGPLLPEVAEELGLTTQAVVCTGVLDQVAGAIGVGNIKPGVFSECTGSALAIVATVDHPIKDKDGRMPCHYHGIPDTYMAHTFTTGGMVMKWFRDKFCQDEMNVAELIREDPYAVMNKEAALVPPGSDDLVMLPHLQGAMAPENNPKAKGVFFGVTLKHTKAHFIRAIMEAVGYIVKRNIEVIEDMGISVSEIRVLGGGAKSPLWNQMKADITGKSILVMENEEAACLGAAIVAGAGVGMFASLDMACQNMVQVTGRYEPDSEVTAAYQRHYQRYVSLYESLVPMFANEGAPD